MSTATRLRKRVRQLVDEGPLGKTKIYELIRTGRLPAHKLDDVTFVNDEDWQALLDSAPLVVPTTEQAEKA
jgi:hypothetical protein